MQRSIFAVLAALTLTGCPYTQGCGEIGEAAPGESGDVGDPADPAGPDPDFVAAPSDSNAPAPVPGSKGSAGPAGVIDFGAAPSGGPGLSTLSCPELAMPKTAGTVFVDGKATGAQLGTRTAPYRTLTQAFTNAAPSAVVYVAMGTYKENVGIPDKDVVVYGGFAPTFASRTNACGTIIEAANTSQPVLSATADVKSFGIEGVTIQKGARGLAVAGDETIQAKFTIARCVFTDNGNTTVVGGGAFLDGVNARIFRSVFKDNKAARGAALASNGNVDVTIDQNLFDRNTGYSDHGGGLYLSAKSTKISYNTFRSNATGVGIPPGFGGNWGGAVIVYKNLATSPAKADFSYNVFTDNLAGIGAAVFVDEGATMTMSHDLIYKNRAYLENGFIRGAAIYVDGTGEAGGGSTFTGEFLTVVNNIYDENRVARPAAAAFGGNVYVEAFSKATITSSVFWNNGDNGFYVEDKNELSVSNSIGTPACTSSNAEGFISASATICKIGAGVTKPASLAFSNEGQDDYRINGMGFGAFSGM